MSWQLQVDRDGEGGDRGDRGDREGPQGPQRAQDVPGLPGPHGPHGPPVSLNQAGIHTPYNNAKTDIVIVENML